MPGRSLKASYTSNGVSCRCILVDVSYRHEPINSSWSEIISGTPFPRLLSRFPLVAEVSSSRRLLECLYIRGVLESVVDFRRGKSE